MTFQSDFLQLTPEQRAKYGVARAKSLAFDAVHSLWRRRRDEGKTQTELANVLNKDEGWLSKNLQGPRNWTMETLGELVEALDGELEIVVFAIEDALRRPQNHHAYAGYEIDRTVGVTQDPNEMASIAVNSPQIAPQASTGSTFQEPAITLER